ncbi:MAG: methionyl-tRNA formyltransferase [Legionellales bacterium]|nr:methionyl-tRNA formyltransferase [Legionellales bacterium]
MTHAKLKLAFAGTPEISRIVLEELINKGQHSVELVLTQPDRPAGRGRKLKQSEVKLCALENNIPVLQPETFKELTSDILKNCDLILVVAYGLFLTPEILAIPKYGCINIHASLLPRWRGAAPIQRAIEEGDNETGITIMKMDSGLDTGPILEQFACSILPRDTARTLHDRLAIMSAREINESLSKIVECETNAIEQDNSKATYAKKISKQDAKIDWTQSAIQLERKIRAFNPFPITHTVMNKTNVRIWEAEIKQSSEDLVVGTLLNTKPGINIMTGKDVLKITKLQLPGKRPISAIDFLNAHPEFINDNKVVG